MRRLLSVALVSGSVFGCGHSLSVGDVSGPYDLESVNGQDIPYSETLGRVTTSVESGTATLGVIDNTWSMSMTYVTSSFTEGDTTLTDTGSGTYTLVQPSTIRFTDSNGDTFAATWDDDTITIIVHPDTMVFRKRPPSEIEFSRVQRG